MRSSVRLLRDIAVGLAGGLPASIQIVAGNIGTAVLALALAGAWIVVARLAGSGRIAFGPASLRSLVTVPLALLSVVRLSESLIPAAIGAGWALVVALDLDRLDERFPEDSTIIDQRLAVRRRLVHLAILGAAGAAVAAAARLVTVPLRMSALLLVLAFVVVAIRQFVVRLVDAGTAGSPDAEPVTRPDDPSGPPSERQ
jgi:hypothetical protein